MGSVTNHPITGEYLSADHVDLLDELADAAADHVRAELALWQVVGMCREAGISWTVIAVPLNVSKQAARQRFSKPPRGQLV